MYWGCPNTEGCCCHGDGDVTRRVSFPNSTIAQPYTPIPLCPARRLTRVSSSQTPANFPWRFLLLQSFDSFVKSLALTWNLRCKIWGQCAVWCVPFLIAFLVPEQKSSQYFLATPREFADNCIRLWESRTFLIRIQHSDHLHHGEPQGCSRDTLNSTTIHFLSLIRQKWGSVGDLRHKHSARSQGATSGRQ